MHPVPQLQGFAAPSPRSATVLAGVLRAVLVVLPTHPCPGASGPRAAPPRWPQSPRWGRRERRRQRGRRRRRAAATGPRGPPRRCAATIAYALRRHHATLGTPPLPARRAAQEQPKKSSAEAIRGDVAVAAPSCCCFISKSQSAKGKQRLTALIISRPRCRGC